MGTKAAIRADARFGRVMLIYALERNPLGWINLTRVLPLAGNPQARASQRRVTNALQQLGSHGLVDVDVCRGNARYRRTVRGRLLAERLIRDHRFSFTGALGRRTR